MFGPFQAKYYYVQWRTNELTVKRLETGETIRRKSNKPFSNDRLLLADFETAEQFLNSIIRELEPRTVFPIQRKMVVHIMERIPGGLSQVEKRAFRDSAEYTGAIGVMISEHGHALSDDQVIAAFKDKDWPYGYL